MIYDALIVGAGPAGSTAARVLARAGWSVGLIEKSSFPRRKVCGEFISATSLPLLTDPAIAREFLTQAGPEIRRVGLFARDVALSSPMPRARNSAGGWGRALGRDKLDSVLLDAAVRAGAKLWQPWKLAALRKDADGYICTIASDSQALELAGRIIIAANGSWERGPFALGQGSTHKPRDLLAFKALFKESDLPSDLMPLLVFPGGYGGMVQTDGDRVSLSCCIRRDVLQRRRDRRRAGDAVLGHILDSCEGARHALLRAKLDGHWLSAGPIQPGIRRRYFEGIFFAGNIAGEAHPIIAEGISMAMQSAWMLCQRLIAAQDEKPGETFADAGKAYSKDWTDAFALRIRAAALFAHAAMRPNIVPVASGLVKRFPAILTWGAQLSGKAHHLPTLQ
jgi:flavin-dependent dehydrogenase